MKVFMLSKEEFIKLITNYNNFRNKIDTAYKLGINLIDGDFHEFPCKLFDKLISIYFNEIGEDWISYYLYEIPLLNCDPVVEDEYGKEIPLRNLDDLWELVKDERNDLSC